MNRQSVWDFFAMYGWAFLLALIVIAALVYFGVFEPKETELLEKGIVLREVNISNMICKQLFEAVGIGKQIPYQYIQSPSGSQYWTYYNHSEVIDTYEKDCYVRDYTLLYGVSK